MLLSYYWFASGVQLILLKQWLASKKSNLNLYVISILIICLWIINKYYELSYINQISMTQIQFNQFNQIYQQISKFAHYKNIRVLTSESMLIQSFQKQNRNYLSILVVYFCLFYFGVSQQSICHYSCSACYSQNYTQCISCNRGYQFDQITGPITLQGTYYAYSFGVCQGQSVSSFNVFGLLILILSVVVFIVKKTERMFLWINTIQTMSMLAFLPIPFIQPLTYLLQSFTVYMLGSVISYPIKQSQSNIQRIQLSLQNDYMLNQYLRTTNSLQNISITGIIQIPLILYTLLIPLFLFIRNKFFGGDFCPKCTQKLLKKIEEGCYIIFYFFIQEMFIILIVGIKYDSKSSASAIVLSLYIIAIIYMSINYYFRPIRFFANKSILYINLLQKIILPICLVLPSSYQFVFLIFMAIFRILNVALNNKKYVAIYQKTKQNIYIALQFCIIICTGILYAVQIKVNSYDISQMLTIFVVIFIIIYFLFIFYQIYDYFKTKDMIQAQKQKQRNQLIVQRISRQNNPTQEGIKMQQQKWSQGEIQFKMMSHQIYKNQHPIQLNQITQKKLQPQHSSKIYKKRQKKRKRNLNQHTLNQKQVEDDSPQKLNQNNKKQSQNGFQLFELKKSQMIKVQRKQQQNNIKERNLSEYFYVQQNSNMNIESSSSQRPNQLEKGDQQKKQTQKRRIKNTQIQIDE